MMIGVPVSVLLWDFGDTLVDERWMRRAPDGVPGWPAAWSDVMAARSTDWDTGRAREDVVFAAMAERTGMTVDHVEAHADVCCRSLIFHPLAWQVAAQKRLPQALVTVNPDLFLKRVVPRYGLEEVFDVIVVSSSEGTTDKIQLCDTAP